MRLLTDCWDGGGKGTSYLVRLFMLLLPLSSIENCVATPMGIHSAPFIFVALSNVTSSIQPCSTSYV